MFETQLGKMLSGKARAGISPRPYLRNLNVQWGVVDTAQVVQMDFNEREREKFRLRNGDLLMCEGAVPGRAAIWRDEIAECYYQKAIHRLRPLDGTALPEFFLFWFRYAFDLANVYGISGASSTIAHLPAAQLRSLSIPVPPLDEQRQIAGVLSAVQQAIERQERLFALTAELKKALMHKLFTEGTRGEPQKQTEVGPVPESWDIIAGSDAFAIKQGQVDPREHPFRDMLHLGPENVEPHTGRFVGLKTNRELRISSGNYHFTPDDIVYSKIRPYLNKAGIPDFEGTCSADMYPLRTKDESFQREFLFQFLLSQQFLRSSDKTSVF